MVTDSSFLMYFIHASLIVKFVMLILLIASIASWAIIFQRDTFLRSIKRALTNFEDGFWSTTDLSKLYQTIQQKGENVQGLETIFLAGFREFIRLRKQPGVDAEDIMEGAQRAMRVAQFRERDELESHLPFLATVGSISPYIGLFGTVWGIMISFHALGGAQQATISMVAPGISEALIATAMGLFAAIPAVVGYNRYINDVDRILSRYEAFQEEFSSFLYRQAHAETVKHQVA